MADKIVAFYPSHEVAERVQDDLEAAGYDHDDARIFSGDGPGLWREMKEAFGFADEEDRYLYEEAARRGQTALLVDLDDADAPDAGTALQILQRHNPTDLDVQAAQWKQQGWKGYQAGQTTVQTKVQTPQPRQPQAQQVTQGEQVIPVVEEQIQIGKRAVQRGGLRIYSRVTERPVEKDVELRSERATVQRRAVDRPVTDADRAFQERAIEVTERTEQPVISKQAKVVEEVVVGKEVETHKQTVRDSVRRSDVEVEKLNPDNVGTTGHTGATAFTDADAYSAELARDQRFRGREWSAVETDARSDFERRYPGSKWEQFKDAIHRGYDRLRQKV